jgi:hypothetical protein
MNRTAAGLAAYGRNGDSTLVHMSPGEVSGLKAFAKANGTTLTVNPHTGLHEAFNLKALLPAAAGLALSPFVGPLAAGLIVGGVHGAATGFENPLQSAMAGFGAYGGAGIGQGLSAAGAAGAAAPVGDAAATMGPDLTGSMALPEAPVDATMGGTYDPSRGYIGARDIADYDVSGASRQQALYDSSKSPASFSNMGKGISGVMDTGVEGSRARDAFMNKVGDDKGLATFAGAASAPAISDAMEPEQMGGTKPISTIRPYSFNREVTPGAFDDLTDSRERRYFNDQFTAGEPYQLAKGGLATFARGGKAKKPDPLEQRYDMADLRDPQSMQKKTMGMYQYAAGGRTLSGPGDGMSDDIKANIDGVQEARLSDGEFVIPADVVSGLGNGSTEAGSKHLKAMMDRVRQQRTGKKQQAKQIKVKGLMPA